MHRRPWPSRAIFPSWICTPWATSAQGIALAGGNRSDPQTAQRAQHAFNLSSAHVPHATGSIKQSSWQALRLLAQFQFVVFGALIRSVLSEDSRPSFDDLLLLDSQSDRWHLLRIEKEVVESFIKDCANSSPSHSTQICCLAYSTPSAATDGHTCRASVRSNALQFPPLPIRKVSTSDRPH